jgi:Glycosyl transferase family 2
MTPYRLSIVIPTFNRPEMFPRALDSAICQKNEDGSPFFVKIILADDSDDCSKTRAILEERYAYPLASGQITHLETGATEAWENWRAGAEAADTDFVTFLQDDDLVGRHYAERILYAFDRAERLGAHPHVWMGCLDCADASGKFGFRYSACGPWVPMETLHGICEPGHWKVGLPIAVSSYFTSWSLSPALAYRNGPRFKAALRAMPGDCDIFVERIIPAEMAAAGGFIADPATIGFWVQHGDNLSRKQHSDQPRQTRLLVQHLDGLLDRLGDWQAPFAAWCGIIPPALLVGWLGQMDVTEREGGKSRHGKVIRRIMLESLMPRCRRVPGPKKGKDRIRKMFVETIAGAKSWLRGKAASIGI